MASNDGYLLQNFWVKRIPCLGIELASTAEAEKKSASRCAWFLRRVRATVGSTRQQGRLIVANNVTHRPILMISPKVLKNSETGGTII